MRLLLLLLVLLLLTGVACGWAAAGRREGFFSMPASPTFELVYDASHPCPGCERSRRLFQRAGIPLVERGTNPYGLDAFPTVVAKMGAAIVSKLAGGPHTLDELHHFASKSSLA